MPCIVVNTTAANEHMAEIDCHMHIIKKWAWAIINMLPYPHLPKCMVIELFYFITMWLTPSQSRWTSHPNGATMSF